LFSGGDSEGETPVPIPNTEVKPLCADGTAWLPAWESRSLPDFFCNKWCLYRNLSDGRVTHSGNHTSLRSIARNLLRGIVSKAINAVARRVKEIP
jgi:hypothetical protein